MNRTVLTFIILLALAATGALLFLGGTQIKPIDVTRGAQGKAMDGDSLFTDTEYSFRVEGVEDSTGLEWSAALKGMEPEPFMEDVHIASKTFSDPGWYHLLLARDGELIAEDSVLVHQGDRFNPSFPMQVRADTVGTAFSFHDRSQNVASRKWEILRNDSTIAVAAEADWNWTAAAPGQYQARLVVLMRSGKSDSASTKLVVVDAPKPDLEELKRAAKRKKDEEDRLAREEAKRTKDAQVAERARLKAERDKKRAAENDAATAQRRAEDEAKKKAAAEENRLKNQQIAEEKARKRQELAEAKLAKRIADSLAVVAANIGPCFAPKRTVSTQVVLDMPDPQRTQVTFERGDMEFTLEVREDCKLTALSCFGNTKAGKMKMTIGCLADECAEPREVTRIFLPALDATEAAQVLLPGDMPMLAAGKNYNVRIETTGDHEAGFFNVAQPIVTSSAVTLTLKGNRSSVFDLVFKK